MKMHIPSGRTLVLGAAGVTAAGATVGIAAGVGVGILARNAWRRMRYANMEGRVVLITGGSRGLGLAMAEEFARLGCKLVICARDENELQIARQKLPSSTEVLTIVCDVSKRDQVEKMVEEATQLFGRIDVLVNNAGVIEVGPIEAQTIEDFQEAMDVMFWGDVYPTLAVLPQMKQRQSGWIANITSIGGKISLPHLVPYCSAKFAAIGFSEGMHAELKKDGICVTTVVPGLMRTGSHVNAYFKGDNQKEYASFSLAATSPLTAIGARRAARTIVDAIRARRAEIILSVPAKAAAIVHGVAPGLTSEVLGMVHPLLPGTGSTSKERHLGKESESAVTRSPLTALGRRAARQFNQVPERATS